MSVKTIPALKKISIVALLCLFASSAWSRQVDFCKVIRTFDQQDLSAPPQITYQDCQGVAFLDYAKDLVKASCWNGAIDLLEGKCESNDHSSSNDSGIENSGIGSEEDALFNDLD